MSTVDLLVLTSSDQLLFTDFWFYKTNYFNEVNFTVVLYSSLMWLVFVKNVNNIYNEVNHMEPYLSLRLSMPNVMLEYFCNK